MCLCQMNCPFTYSRVLTDKACHRYQFAGALIIFSYILNPDSGTPQCSELIIINGKCLEIKGQSVPAHFTPPTIIKMGYYLSSIPKHQIIFEIRKSVPTFCKSLITRPGLQISPPRAAIPCSLASQRHLCTQIRRELGSPGLHS